MPDFTIGQVEKLTGIKAHILRYWEECIPFLMPRKDALGRRLYSAREVQIIQRLQYLVQERKYTIEGAGEAFLQEAEHRASATIEMMPILGEIQALRNLLLNIYATVQRHTSAGDSEA